MSDNKVIKLGGKCRDKKRGGTLLHSSHEDAKKDIYCSFCGRSGNEVLKMVKGPGVNICSECTMIAVQYLIMQDKMLSSEAQQILDAFWGSTDNNR